MFEQIKKETNNVWEFGNGDIGLVIRAEDEMGIFDKCYRFDAEHNFIAIEEYEIEED